jgi:hypothetical protein
VTPAPPRPPVTLDELVQAHQAWKVTADLALADGDYNGAQLPSARLEAADLTRSEWQDADLRGARLAYAKLRRASFTKALLQQADLRGADLRGADFTAADLRRADLRGCQMDRHTQFLGAMVDGASIDRHSLRQLGPSFGGLSEADRALMQVHDDAITLAMHFGGWQARLHLAAVLLFLLPYADFTLRTVVATRLAGCAQATDCLPMAMALWHQVRTGGRGDATDALGLAIFGLLLALNGLRVALLWRAQRHRAEELASGLPRHLQLNGPWRVMFKAWRVLIWVNVVLIAGHLMHWLQVPVRSIASGS